MKEFIPALILLVLLAAVVRDDTVLTLCYLMTAVFFVGRWWSRRAFLAVEYNRHFTDRAFPNETVPVTLDVRNTSWLPVVWMSLYDSAVPELSPTQSFREVISLGPRAHRQYRYELNTYKRGYYPVGPLFVHSGDLFGLSDDALAQRPADRLTVYPRVVPITRLGLPSRSPLGTLRHTQPIFEDPARVIGKRDYVSGDSLRRVDWKSTAALGRLQVKQFEPSIALDTVIALDLESESYERRTRFDDSELAIVVAASVANYVVMQKQTVGLLTNAKDAAAVAAAAPPVQFRAVIGSADDLTVPAPPRAPALVPSRKGRQHLMRLLEVLARAQLSDGASPFAQLIQNQLGHIPWGTTLILITGKPDDSLFDSLFRTRRAGLNGIVILVGQGQGFESFHLRAEQFGFTVYGVVRERDLEMWRG